MKCIKIFSALLGIVIMLSCFTACVQDDGDLNNVFSQLIVSSDETESEALPFAEHIYVIIPHDCSGELSLKARELADGIKSKTGILTSLKYDTEMTVSPKGSCEVLLGDTNRLASDNAIDSLKDDEYLCHWDDGAVVICGRNDSSTINAIDRFIDEVLPSATKYSLMPSGARIEYKFEYVIERIILNGYDLYDYALVYPESNTCSEKEIAIGIRDFISSKSGYYLDVISNKELTVKNERIIMLSRSDANALSMSANGILLSGTDSYSLSLVAARLMSDIKSGAVGGRVDLNYTERIVLDAADTSFESAFCFLKENEKQPLKPHDDFIKLLKNQSTGICFIGNPNDTFREDLALNMSEPFEFRDITIGKREIMIVYNKDKIKKIDVTVGDGFVRADVKATFDEVFSYIYIIDEYLPSERAQNTVLFYENHDAFDFHAFNCAASGDAKLTVGEISYFLACDNNIAVTNSNDVIIDNESELFCDLKGKLVLSREFLNYTLK